MSGRTTTTTRTVPAVREGRLPGGPRAPRWVQGLLFASDPMGVLRRAKASYGPVFTLRLPLMPTFVVVCEPEAAIALLAEPRTPHGADARRDRTGLPLRRLRSQRIVARRVLPAETDVLVPLAIVRDASAG